MSGSLSRSERAAIAESVIPDLRLNHNTGWARGPCPFCLMFEGKRDKKHSFGFNHYTKKFSCYRCGTYGWLEGAEHEAIELPPPPPVEAIDPPEGFFPLWTEEAYTSKALLPALYYLGGRGLTQELIEWARIGACVSGRYKGRVVIPVFDDTGMTWIGFVARAWFKGAKRTYLNADGHWGSTTLYNGGALQEETDIPAIVVEGAFDTYPYWPDGVAVFGKPGPQQIDMLMEASRPWVMVLDGDAWREGEGISVSCKLRGARCGAVRLPPGADPDQVPTELVRQAAVDSLETLTAVEVVIPSAPNDT